MWCSDGHYVLFCTCRRGRALTISGAERCLLRLSPVVSLANRTKFPGRLQTTDCRLKPSPSCSKYDVAMDYEEAEACDAILSLPSPKSGFSGNQSEQCVRSIGMGMGCIVWYRM